MSGPLPISSGSDSGWTSTGSSGWNAARIQADRAARQYHAIEPENRLVARELERRWETGLQEQRELEEQYDRFLADRPRQLTATDRHRIEALAMDIPALWHSPGTTIQERQTIIRCLVERITVAVRGETEWVDVTIRWAGGMESRHQCRRPVHRYEQLSNYRVLRDRVLSLHRAGMSAAQIAERLNGEGFHTPYGVDRFRRHSVWTFLRRQGLAERGTTTRVNPKGLPRHEWRLSDLAGELEVPVATLRSWRSRGWVTSRKSAESDGAWILWADDREIERLRRLRVEARGLQSDTPSGACDPARKPARGTKQIEGRQASLRPQGI